MPVFPLDYIGESRYIGIIGGYEMHKAQENYLAALALVATTEALYESLVAKVEEPAEGDDPGFDVYDEAVEELYISTGMGKAHALRLQAEDELLDWSFRVTRVTHPGAYAEIAGDLDKARRIPKFRRRLVDMAMRLNSEVA